MELYPIFRSPRFFIGNLSEEIPEHMLREFCLGFGQLKECRVMKEDDTGRSRGFGFVEFVDSRVADSFEKAFPHIIYDRSLNVRRCGGMKQPLLNNAESKRVMVSHPSMESQAYFLKHFSKFGPISKITSDFGYDVPLTGYTFVDFTSPDSVAKCLLQKQQRIDGTSPDLHIRKVLTKEQTLRILQKEREETYRQAREQTGSHSTSVEITRMKTESLLRNKRTEVLSSGLASDQTSFVRAQKRESNDYHSSIDVKNPRYT